MGESLIKSVMERVLGELVGLVMYEDDFRSLLLM
jgi:hypothetical protein